jgi:hypothetical protein
MVLIICAYPAKRSFTAITVATLFDKFDQFSAPLLAKYHIPVRLDGAGLKAC